MPRVIGIDIPDNKRLEISLTYLYGIGRHLSNEIIAKLGLDPNMRALPELKAFSDVHIVEKRIVRDGNIWSSGGISSGIDLALELIAEIAGKEIAGEVQLLFEYFPRDKAFASLNSINKLPPYYTVSKAFLPQYISDYIQSKTKD